MRELAEQSVKENKHTGAYGAGLIFIGFLHVVQIGIQLSQDIDHCGGTMQSTYLQRQRARRFERVKQQIEDIELILRPILIKLALLQHDESWLKRGIAPCAGNRDEVLFRLHIEIEGKRMLVRFNRRRQDLLGREQRWLAGKLAI